MITTLLFDFNNLLLFASKQTAETASSRLAEIEIPGAMQVPFYLNAELLDYIQSIDKRYKKIILSASEFTLMQPVVKNAIKPYFEQVIMAKQLGLSKDQVSTYTSIAESIGQLPDKIVFSDDTYNNVEAATQAGLHTIHFTNNQDFIFRLNKLLKLEP